MQDLQLGTSALDLEDVLSVAIHNRAVKIPPATFDKISQIRTGIEAFLSDDAPNVYGVNTGFGALAEVRIAKQELERLQANLIRSHATGVGEPFSEVITRAIMLLRANVLTLGSSGTRPCIPELLCEMLNRKVHPIIPEKGSVGASGDLAPLAHLALVLMGEGEAIFGGVRLSGGEALSKAGLAPLVLEPKEGLALINGTQAMTADLALSVDRARNLLASADIIGSLSIQALLGSVSPFDVRIQTARGFTTQVQVASNIRRLTDGSPIVQSHTDCDKVQDPYSLRCIPQVHGACRTVWAHVREVVNVECNAATDNPLVFQNTDGGLDLISGGNFHGQPIAFVADYLALGLAEIANISERRIEQLVNPHLSSGLPPFLANASGVNSGFMIAQVTAAALVSENKVLAHPASVDSIPSSANREDHVSMGTIAARKARQILEHAETVLAIELLCATQGMTLRHPLKASPAGEAVIAAVRALVPPLDEDRILYHDIARAVELVRSGGLIRAVEDVLSQTDGLLP